MRGGLSGVIGYFTRHPTAANLLLVLMLVAGLAAATQIRAQFMPDDDADEIEIEVAWPGAGPEDVDAAIIAPLQPVLSEVEGVAESDAVAQQGRARVVLEFEPGYDMARAVREVQTAVDGITTFPEDAETPEVAVRVWNERVTNLVLSGPIGFDQMVRYTDDFIARLYDAGITRTEVGGIADPEIAVIVDALSLIRHDVTLEQIAAAIGSDVDSLPAGTVDGANARIRTGTARRTAEDVARIVIGRGPDGAVLRLGDVAEVSRSAMNRTRAYSVLGLPAVSIRVERVAGGDALAIQDTVERVAAEFNATLPEGTSVDLIRTRSDSIAERLAILLDNGVLGLALVLVLLFLFLNARTALWVAAGIPVAMCGAIAMMYGLGLSLNMVSLFGLIITLGIVVDDAIVVAEHADARARRLGEPPEVAAERAARRMFLPVFTATITTIIAFWALTLVGGRFGSMVMDIPLTVIVVLAASLIECFLILPHHMAHALRHTAREHWYDWPSRKVNRGFRWIRERGFRPLLAMAVRARYVVLAGAIALLVSQVTALISGDVPWRFFNAPERGSVTVNIAMVNGAGRADTAAQIAELERAVAAVGAAYAAEHGTDPVDFVLSEIGDNAGRGLPGTESKDADLLGAVTIELIDADDRPYSSHAFTARLRDEVAELPLLERVSFQRWWSGPGGEALAVSFYGADTAQLKAAADAFRARAGAFPEVSSLEDDLAYDRVEFVLELTDRGAALGFTSEDLGRALRHRLNGIEAANFPAGMRSGTIRVEVPEAEKTADFLQSMLMRTPEGTYVPLADLVTLRQQEGYSVLRRDNGRRVVTVTGDISEDDPARAQEVSETLRATVLPAIADEFDVSWYLSGLAEDERAFLSDAALGFVLCLVGIFLVLTWIFASWWRPLTIMAIIPFGLIGAVWGHAWWDVPLSMFSVVGLIGMAGIIINDSIVLVSTVDEYARRRALIPAVIDATVDRLRPVVLTTLTTVLGLAPLLHEGSQQAQFLRPTIITLVYGLSFGMLLVLVLVPALLVIGRDVRVSLRAARRAHARRRLLPARARLALLGTCAGLLVWGLAVLLPSFGDLGAAALPAVLQSRASAMAVFAVGVAGFALVLAGALALFGRRAD